MKHMPKRDVSGKCSFGCRDRVREGQRERQLNIDSESYSEPLEKSPEWVRDRKDQPGVYGGRV